jgi:UDP-glucose 6-dehydrogenase
VTACNRQPSASHHAERQRGHKPENRDCNTCLLVGKSTVPVGTARRVRDQIRALAPAGCGVDLAWNPEFLREGTAAAGAGD